MDFTTDYAVEKNMMKLFANIAIGATGAPTITAKKNKGILSIARNSAGNYTIKFDQGYQYLMFLDFVINLNSGAPSAGTNVQAMVRTDNSNGSTPSITIEFVNSAGTAVELANGCTVLLKATLKYGTI